MAKSAKQAPEEKAAKPKSKMLLIIIVVLLLLGAAGGAGWYFTQGKSSAKETQEAAQPVYLEKPKFVALDTFTVNLQHEDADRYLQTAMSLKIYDPTLEEKIKEDMPEIRSKLLLLLSSKRASELSTVAGKKKLADQIITQVDGVLGVKRAAPAAAASGVAAATKSKAGIVDVLFTSFIIQ